MSEPEASEKLLRCSACGNRFVYSAGEQELFRLRGITTEPDHCPNCARGRVLASPRAPAAERSSG